ncbi:MAG: hypothetical protein KDB82_11560 [Planctomycetes bacterium]|nr:hypothetical protein [Planctomycetota bacterium]
MSQQAPTKIKHYRYDPELKRVVLLSEAECSPGDLKSLNPEVRKRLEDFLAKYGDKRKSS